MVSLSDCFVSVLSGVELLVESEISGQIATQTTKNLSYNTDAYGWNYKIIADV